MVASVKTNRNVASFSLLSSHVREAYSDRHVYVFVNLKGKLPFEYFVVPSIIVARRHVYGPATTGSLWYMMYRDAIPEFADGWQKVFGQAATISADQTDAIIVEPQ